MAGTLRDSGGAGTFEPVNFLNAKSDERFFGNILKNRSFFAFCCVVMAISDCSRFDFT